MAQRNRCEGSSDDKESKRTEIQELDEYLNDNSNHLYQFLDNLTRRVKAANSECKQLSKEFANRVEVLEKENQAIKKRLTESEKLRERYRQERNNLRTESEKFGREERRNASTEVEKLLRLELVELQNLNKQLDNKWERKLKESEETNAAMIRDQKHKIEQLEKDIKQSNLKVKYHMELMEECKVNSRNMGVLRKQLDDREKQLNDTNDRLYRLSAKLKETEIELDETKTRLSKAMGDKLTDNNPNIADLSDKNRPTKLAEKYAEMYDNEWTDAYEMLESWFNEEKEIIKALLQILEDVMEFCKDKAKSQMDGLKMALSCSNSQIGRSIPDNISKQLKDCRKAMADISKENIYQQFIKSDGGNRICKYQVGDFVEKCINICWFMAIQDPPIVFGPVTASGDLFDTDVYKHYTSSGHYVDYVVWPALLLHEGGPVLSKGVAQGCGEKLYRRKEAWVYDSKYPEVTSRVVVGGTDKYGHGSSGSRGTTTAHRDYSSSRVTYLDQSKTTFEKGGFVGSGMDRHYRTRRAEETRIYPSAAGRISTNPLSSSTAGPSSERDPTNREMELFLRYYDRRDFIKAREVLGSKVYERCWQTANKNYKLY